MNNPSVKTILILAANPTDVVDALVDDEIQRIDAALARAGQRDRFQLITRQDVGTVDLRRAILDHRPHIVHFVGHGEGEDGIRLVGTDGKSQLVPTSGLSGFFRQAASVECVLFSACYSAVQADAIVEHVNCVIGMNRLITGEAATHFAEAFYDTLGAGEPLAVAFDVGCSAIGLENRWLDNSPEARTPVLRIKDLHAPALHLRMIDRENVIPLFLQLMQPHSPFRILRLTGPGKIGKSHLLNKLFPVLARKLYGATCAILDLRNPSLEPLHHMNAAATQLGGEARFPTFYAAYQEYVRNRPTPVEGDLAATLARLSAAQSERASEEERTLRTLTEAFVMDLRAMDEQAILLVCDAVDDAAETTRRWLLDSLLLRLTQLSHVRIAVGGRELPDTAATYAALCHTQPLPPVLAEDAYIDYCRHARISLGEQSIRDFAKACDYKPGMFAELTLKFAQPAGGGFYG